MAVASDTVVRLADWQVNHEQLRLCYEVLDSGRLTYGPMSQEFERQWSALHGWQYGVFVNSGTNALKIALCALRESRGWPAGSEVIVPAVTFVATWNAVRMAGLTPVLCDVDETLNINVNAFAPTSRTVAALPVHLLGRPADSSLFRSAGYLFRSAGYTVLEDSCECAFVDTGLKGTAACYSFYASHHLVTGVGGMVCTNDPDLAELCRSYSFHGRDVSYLSKDDLRPANAPDRFRFPRSGFSDRAGELEAALGLGGLTEWRELFARRLANARYLADALERSFVEGHAYMFFPYFSERRDELVAHLEAAGVETREIMPLTNQPILAGLVDPTAFPVADRVNRTGLLLPCHPYLTERDLDRIVAAVHSF